MEVCSRLWSSTVVGRHSYANTKALFSDTLLRGEVVGTPLIMTDGFEFYERVIRRLLGVACIYAQVIKTWRKDRVTRVERRAIIGTTRRLEKALDESEDSARANTAYIERLNLTIRQSVAYLRRRSPTHARCERRLHRQLELARCHYNFIRRHTGLRFGRALRTPSMVAGLRDRGCSFRDVFGFA
jgi:IS1 family transposase